MNKIYNYLSLAALALSTTAMVTSCDNSKDNDFVSEYDGAPGIYFSNTANSYLELSDQASTITYTAYRDVAGEEITVGLSVEAMDTYADPNIFTFPSSVTFAQGSKTADIVIGYDISKTTIGEEQQFQLTLDATPNPFSSNQVVITLVNPAPWTLLGTNGQYFDYGWGVSDTSAGPVTVSVYRQGLDPNLYRISNPYVGFNGEDTYFQFRVLQVGDTYYGETITEPDLVAFDMYYITYDADENSDIYLAFPGMFQGLEDPSNWTNCRVLEYQDDGVTPGLIELGPLYYVEADGSAYGDLSPYVYIYFPGYVSMDTSLEISYEGALTSEDLSEYLLVDGEMGQDLSEVRVAYSNTMNADQLVSGIEDGTVSYTSFTTSGAWKVPVKSGMETGQYTLVAVGYVDGVAKSYVQLSFYYVAKDSDFNPNEGWTSLGYCRYTDGYIVSGLFTGTNKITYRVELQQSEENPGMYRLVNPYGTYFASFFNGVVSSDMPPHYIVIDATNPRRVKVNTTEQVIDFGDGFSLVYTSSWAYQAELDGATPAEIESEGLYGTLANNLITFPPMTLCALWSDEPDQWYSANYALDYDAYQAGEEFPIYYDENGDIFAPFQVQLDELTDEAPQIETRGMALSSHAFNLPKSASMLSMQHQKKTIKASTKKSSQKGNLQKRQFSKR